MCQLRRESLAFHYESSRREYFADCFVMNAGDRTIDYVLSPIAV